MSVRKFLSNVLLTNPLKVRANSGPGQFSGITQLASNTATVTVSTTAVRSNSVILYGHQSLVNQTSGQATALEVRTIVHGAYFVFSTAGGETIANRASNIHWMIFNQQAD